MIRLALRLAGAGAGLLIGPAVPPALAVLAVPAVDRALARLLP